MYCLDGLTHSFVKCFFRYLALFLLNKLTSWIILILEVRHLMSSGFIFYKLLIAVLCLWGSCVSNTLSWDFLFHSHMVYFVLFFLYCLFFRATSMAYGGSQSRGLIGAASLPHSHSNARSEPYLQPTPQLMAIPDP